MPARAVLYVVLSAVVMAALTISAILVFSYRQPGAVADIPSPTAAIDRSAPAATVEAPPEDAPPVTPQATRTTTESLAKQTQPESLAPEQLKGYDWPVRNAFLTSRMEPRIAGFVLIDGQEVHDGVDLATFCGDKVRAAHDGTVLYAGRNFDPFFGYLGDPSPIYARLERLHRVNQQPIVVVIDDGNGYRSVYVHLQEAHAEPGTEVKAGEVIGLEGATGYASGCHLHYGLIRMDGEWQEVVPQLLQFGYPPFVRERVNPLKVLPWADPDAPAKLRDRVLGTATPAPSSSITPTPTPTPSPTQVPGAPSPASSNPQPISRGNDR
jgi:murein DD-endopeptidase MepM/ murein hydrolase activator NlpD